MKIDCPEIVAVLHDGGAAVQHDYDRAVRQPRQEPSVIPRTGGRGGEEEEDPPPSKGA